MLVMGVLLGLLGVVLFIVVGALVELFQQVQQIRAYLDLVDRVTLLDLGASRGRSPSTVGLPAALDHADRALVLFISDRCDTCRTIAATLDGGALPQTLWLVVEPISDDASPFIEEFRLHGERVLVDQDGSVAERLGLSITPSAVLVAGGRLDAAQTVPTVRQLYAALPTVREHALAPID